ncbi:PQQ-binding-like beta-propeller repeat protein [Streptomyces sp. NPDC005356]|uniref:outer membrane protein assembly factor BamB family protein n=1 Tax=Streptomyces sp. NPDC005356 TaxID=3157167 RepID=UPI0033BA9108
MATGPHPALPRIEGLTVLARRWHGAATTAYVARDRHGDTVLAVVPHPELMRSPALRRRFREECSLAQRAAGPWVAPVRETRDDLLVTGYRPALPLHASVTRHGPLSESAVRILGGALAETLVRLHTLVPLHQGLTPHTVQLTVEGPLLTGFGPLGAATRVDTGSPGHPRLTLGFLTPEQVVRDTPGPASDVFVLGLLLVYAATGAGPFAAATADAVAEADAALDDVPTRLRPLLARCLEKDPAQRPTPGEVADQLAPSGAAALLSEGWLTGPVMAELAEEAATVLSSEPPPGPPTLVNPTPSEGPTARPPAPTRPTPVHTRRALLTGTAGVVLGAGGGWALGQRAGGDRPAARPVTRPSRVTGTAPTALWHYKAVEQGRPALMWQDSLVILPLIGQVVALDARTGKVRWSKDLLADGDIAPIGGDLLIAATWQGLVRVSARTGTVKDRDTAYPNVQGILAHDGRHVWFVARSGLVCYDAMERAEVWHSALPRNYSDEMKVVVGRDALYLQCFPAPDSQEKGKARFAVVDRRTGKIGWEGPVDGILARSHAWISAEGMLYAEGTHEKWPPLTSYDLRTRKKLRTYKSELGTDLTRPRAVLQQGDALYATNPLSTVNRYDTEDGTLRWSSPAPGDVSDSGDFADLAAVTSGDLVLHLDWRSVTAIDSRTGKPVWVFQGIGEPENDGLMWQVTSDARTTVFARESGKHYFALPIG